MNRHPGEATTRILVVDDHRISRQFLAAALRQNGVDVKQAATASRARSIALTWLPDIVLMDVRLGDDSGFDLARELCARWRPGLRKPQILMLTAEAPRDNERGQTRKQDFPMLRKPVNVRHLLNSVRPRVAAMPSAPCAPARPRLQKLFREELAAQLPLLEDALGKPDLPRAGGILHNLIASSGLSGEQRLERRLRSLQGACERKKTAAGLACEYYLLLNCARRFTGPITDSERP